MREWLFVSLSLRACNALLQAVPNVLLQAVPMVDDRS
jgi:hypothetical protein